MGRLFSVTLVIALLMMGESRAQDFWVPASEGMYGGSVSSMDIDREGRLYAATRGGIYRSDDRGLTWQQVPLIAAGYLASATVGPDGHIYGANYDSIYVSRDRGDSWIANAISPALHPDRLLEVDSAGYVYAGYGNLIRSADGGITWDTIIPRSRIDGSRIITSLAVPDLMLAATEHVLFLSSNRGESWDSVAGPTPIGDEHENLSAVVVPDGTILLGTTRGLYRSIDRALNWTRVDTLSVRNLHAGPDGKIYQIVAPPPGYITIPPYAPVLRVSTDNGVTWSTLGDRGILHILAHPSGDLIAAYGDISRSTDGGATWSAANRGLTNFHAGRIALGPGGVLAANRGGRVAISRDDAASWTITGENPDWRSRIFGFFHDGSLIAGVDEDHGYIGRFDRSADLGVTWTTLLGGATGEPMVIRRAPSGDVYIGTGENGGFGSGSGNIYRSADLGATWDSIGFDRPIGDIAVKRTGEIFALSYGYSDVGPPFGGNALHRSLDGGTTWQTLNDTIVSSAVVIDRNGVIYVDFDYVDWYRNDDPFNPAREHYILRSVDNGDTWTSSRLEIGGIGWIECLAIDSAGAIYAGTYDQGVFRSTDEGRTWSQLNSGLRNLRISSITVTPSGYVVVGTYHNGVFRSRLAQSGAPVTPPVPTTGSFPNPASGVTTIVFTNPTDGVVTIDLFTITGERIATLLEARRSAGSHEIRFDVSDLADGVYLYRVRSGDSEMSERLTVLRRR